MHRPGGYVSTTPTLTKSGVMTAGVAKITLNNTETLVVNEESPLLIAEKGVQGEKGDKGERGRKGSVGKPGPKVLTWSKEIVIQSNEVTELVVFPYDGTDHNLSKLDIVVQGKGQVTFYLIEKQTGERLAVINTILADELTIVSHDDFAAPASDLTILTLEANTEELEGPIKFLALTVTLKSR